MITHRPDFISAATKQHLPTLPMRPDAQDSIYTPPRLSDPGEGLVRSKSETLVDNGYMTIKREAKWDLSGGWPRLKSVSLIIDTGNKADTLYVGKGPDGHLNLQINGKAYAFDSIDPQGQPINLQINTRGGNDRVTISPDVNNPATIDGGDGDDTLTAGGGKTRLLGGAGNDTLRLGSNTGYAEGNDGDDTLIGGSGNAVMYGNNGNDQLYAGAGPVSKQSYLDGGSGDDRLYAGNGHTILHGGKGNDQLVGCDRTTFYTGKGKNQIINNRRGDRIYAKAGDAYDASQGSAFTKVKTSNAGDEGFSVVGRPKFKQRVADDFEFLRSSPTGQKMLEDMDREAANAGGKVTVREERENGNSYLFGSSELDKLRHDRDSKVERDDPRRGRVYDGQPGARADKGVLNYDPMDLGDPRKDTLEPPIVGLIHEMGHAYNGATGTNLPGRTLEHSPSEPAFSSQIPNTEFQVVGLPSSAQPYDFDNDPATPPTATNPEHFTENGMLRELGLPERKSYLS
ncbi:MULTISPECIES: M91 family zinc metallopeptidase [unclassified Pseudomonas]|uniref:M91 family zinc metallopeptidase n=1 Tax=unclassified Pseudomonas TaxID=196821 RepID=UPI00332C81BC